MFVPVCARLLKISLPAVLSLTFSLPVAAQDAMSVDIRGGTVVFDAATNVSAISVHGKSTAMDGHARVRQTEQGLAIEQIEASVPIASLATGMGLRDSHMRKYVFTTSDDQVPDLRFEASRADCAHAGGGRDMTCNLSGTLAIRGTAQPFALTLRVNESGSGGGFHATGDAEITLSAWQIERPSQLGVQTADAVKLHIEFATKAAANVTTTAYRGER